MAKCTGCIHPRDYLESPKCQNASDDNPSDGYCAKCRKAHDEYHFGRQGPEYDCGR